jgi:glycerol-3-phosphate O-acyltransferase
VTGSTSAVVDAYVRKLLRDGHAIELFLEGGRSRSGKLLAPMLGLLNMVVDAALGAEGTRVFFVPISIAYERMMEDKAFARELLGHAKERESARSLVEVAGVLREQYGRVSVQVGELTELSALARELGVSPGDGVPPAKRRALVTRLAYRVMNEINRVTTVTPGALVATVLLSRGPRALSHRELVSWALRLATRLARDGARLTPTLSPSAGEPSREAALVGALTLYAKAGYLEVVEPGRFGLGDDPRAPELRVGEAAMYRAVEAQRVRLDYAKNVSVHAFVERALVATAFLGLSRGASLVPEARLADAVRTLSRLFKHELLFRSELPFEAVLADVLARLVADGTLTRPYADALALGPGGDGATGAEWLAQDAAIVRNFLEGYRVAARSLKALRKGPMAKRELALRGLRLGQEMLLRGELERAEAVVRTLLDNAYDAFQTEGYLEKRDGKLALTPSFDDDDALATIEARVVDWLGSGSVGQFTAYDTQAPAVQSTPASKAPM